VDCSAEFRSSVRYRDRQKTGAPGLGQGLARARFGEDGATLSTTQDSLGAPAYTLRPNMPDLKAFLLIPLPLIDPHPEIPL